MPSPKRCFVFCATLMSVLVLDAQVKSLNLTGSDLEWQSLRSAAFAPPDADLSNLSDEALLKAAVSRQAARFHQSADLAKAFYVKNPAHAKALEARKLEALMLIQAVQSGDTAIEGRMENTVNIFSNDQSVPEYQRAEIAGTHSFLGLAARQLSPSETSRAQESIARSLILSFPRQPQGYESLVTIAHSRDVVGEKAMLQEVMTMPAPAPVKQMAQLLLDRLALVGKPLVEALNDAGAKTTQAGLVAGKPTVIYTWASWSPGSIELGKNLAKKNISTVNFVGLNLDSDPTAAAALAAKNNLPGTLQYDGRGVEGALAKRLKVNGAPLVFLVDAQGVVQDVRGTDDLDKKLATLGL